MLHLKLQLHYAIYRLRFYSKSLIHILSLSNSHNNVASIQRNRDDKSHRVIVAIWCQHIGILKTLGRLKLQLLVPIQCFTLCTTARNHCVMFVFFSFLCSLSSHCTFTSVFEIFKSLMATDFPRVIIITSVLFGRSKEAY